MDSQRSNDVSPEQNVASFYKTSAPPSRQVSTTRKAAAVPERLASVEKLPVQPITPLLHLELKHVPRILTQRGWANHDAKWAYQWAIQQPKTALLLWMSGELQAWSL